MIRCRNLTNYVRLIVVKYYIDKDSNVSVCAGFSICVTIVKWKRAYKCNTLAAANWKNERGSTAERRFKRGTYGTIAIWLTDKYVVCGNGRGTSGNCGTVKIIDKREREREQKKGNEGGKKSTIYANPTNVHETTLAFSYLRYFLFCYFLAFSNKIL